MQDGLIGGWFDRAKSIQRLFDESGLGRPSSRAAIPTVLVSDLEKYDAFVSHPDIRSASRELFEDQHYARAVEEAFKCLNNAVKRKSGFSALDGAKLMRKAFSANSPVLALNALSSQSEEDEQQGYMDVYAGAMTGVRNPRAHEHELEDEPEVALELLALANHLMRKLDHATKKT